RVQRSQIDQKSINKALVAVTSNQKREREQIEVIEELIGGQNAELEYKDDRYGRTPLIWAVTVDRKDIVSVLLENGAQLETKDQLQDWTPLMWAVWWGHEAIIRLLIDRGARLNATDTVWDRTPLLWAVKRGACGAASLLHQIS